ncbi:MAG: hypothetical protein NC399_09480 [Muribaculum sp.]|nr:hypothetical protein [Muribaculum sp.]
MKKKVLALLLASTMVVSLAACGNKEGSEPSTPATDSSAEGSSSTQQADPEPYNLENLKIVANGTLNLDYGQGLEEFQDQLAAGIGEHIGHDITVEITKIDHSGYTDAVGRLFAAQDYPDVMIMSADMFKQYAPTGLLWDMADAYENSDTIQSHMGMPAINENLKDSSGALYGFAPTYGNGCVTYVKKAWMDAVGVTEADVTDWAGYYDMLLKFHNEDPDGNGTTGDTYGVIAAGYMGNEAPWINYMPEFWQDAYPAFLQDENGVWYDGFQTDATKAALARLAQGHADGAIDPQTLTATTKIAREAWFSNDQKGSSGAFTYWAGNWYQTLTNNLVKNEVNADLVEIKPIKEITDTVGGYLNREAPVWVIIDQGDEARNQAVFEAFVETMLDGDTVQTLWTYGPEGITWSMAADDGFTTNPGTDKEKVYGPYSEGEFHLLQAPGDANSVYSKNHIDPALVVAPLTNGLNAVTDLAQTGNVFFTENCVDAPASPASDTWTEKAGDIYTAKLEVISAVVINGQDIETAIQDKYLSVVGADIETILGELNGN